MNKKNFLLCLAIIFVSSGCETSTTVRDQNYYIDRARAAIEKYRVPDRREFYGFVLGDRLEATENYRGAADEETGGVNYSLKDQQGIFDHVLVLTDQNGVILRIQLMKKFSNRPAGLTFYNAVAERLKTTYPAYHESGALLYVNVAKSDDDWLRMYSQYLKRKEQSPSTDWSFSHVLHPTLAVVECALVERQEGYLVGLEFTGKEYYRVRESHKKELQQKLGHL